LVTYLLDKLWYDIIKERKEVMLWYSPQGGALVKTHDKKLKRNLVSIEKKG